MNLSYMSLHHIDHIHILLLKKKINQNKHHISLINVCAFSITFLSDLKRMSGMKWSARKMNMLFCFLRKAIARAVNWYNSWFEAQRTWSLYAVYIQQTLWRRAHTNLQQPTDFRTNLFFRRILSHCRKIWLQHTHEVSCWKWIQLTKIWNDSTLTGKVVSMLFNWCCPQEAPWGLHNESAVIVGLKYASDHLHSAHTLRISVASFAK